MYEGIQDSLRILIEKTTTPELLQEYLSNFIDNYQQYGGNIKQVKKYLDELERSFIKIIIMLVGCGLIKD